MRVVVTVAALVLAGTAVGQDNREDLILKKLAEIQKSIDGQRDELADLKRRVEALEGRRDGGAAPAQVPVRQQAGLLRVVNEFPAEVTVVVNGQEFRVPRGETRQIEVPAGEFQYQVLGIQDAPVHRRVDIGRTFSVRVYEVPGDV